MRERERERERESEKGREERDICIARVTKNTYAHTYTYTHALNPTPHTSTPLDGSVVFTSQQEMVAVVKDKTSDIAMSAKNGSALLSHVR